MCLAWLPFFRPAPVLVAQNILPKPNREPDASACAACSHFGFVEVAGAHHSHSELFLSYGNAETFCFAANATGARPTLEEAGRRRCLHAKPTQRIAGTFSRAALLDMDFWQGRVMSEVCSAVASGESAAFGTAWAVSGNNNGQLGDGNTADRLGLMRVMGGVHEVSTGFCLFVFAKMDATS